MEKKRIHFDENGYKEELTRYSQAAQQLNGLVAELELTGLKLNDTLISSIFDANTLIQAATLQLRKETEGMSFAIDKRRHMALLGELSKQLQDIAHRAGNAIRMISRSLLSVKNSCFLFPEESKKQLEEKYSIYADTEEKETAYNKAIELKKAIDDFNSYLISCKMKYPNFPVKAIGTFNRFRKVALVEVTDDGVLLNPHAINLMN